jgi:hypothetical protein
MRRGRRYTAHRSLLLTFLLFGSAGSFILGQEAARAIAAVPIYAAQSITFSGAGITASLVTPLQASGAIGQRTPTPKVVKPHSKVLPSKTASPPHSAPAKPPPMAPARAPAPVVQPSPPCASAPCDPDPHPAPPTTLAPGAVPILRQVGTTIIPVADPSTSPSTGPAPGVTSPPCAPLGRVMNPAALSHETTPARCVPAPVLQPTPSLETPKPAAPDAGETLSVDRTIPEVNPAPAVVPVAPTTATSVTVAAPPTPSAISAISPAVGDPVSASATQTAITPTTTLDTSGQVAPLDPVAPAPSEEQATQP